MANVLIVHTSRYGQTQKIAQHMAKSLRTRGHAVELLEARNAQRGFDVRRFEVVLVGAPVYAGKYLRPILDFAREHRAELEGTTSAFFSVNLAIASRTTDGRAETLPLIDAFAAETGWRPARVALFAGALAYSKYNFLIRFIMRRIARKAGGETDTSRDHEYTDWNAVERFAEEAVAAAPGAAVRASPAERAAPGFTASSAAP